MIVKLFGTHAVVIGIRIDFIFVIIATGINAI